MTDTADPIPTCSKCNQPHVTYDGRAQACTGHRSNGNPCTKYPIGGGHVCDTHGGRAPQVRRAAAERATRKNYEARATAALVSLGGSVRPEEHPIDGLLREIQISAQAVEYYANAIAELDLPDPINDVGPLADVVGVDEEGDPILRQPYGKLYGRSASGDLGIHPLVKLWNEERDRHARICKLAIDAGISERLVAMAERTGHQVAVVIVGVIDALGLPDDQRTLAKQTAATRLRELTAGTVIDVPGQ